MADIANLLQSTSPRAPRSTGGFPASLSASAEDANRPVTVNHDFEPSAGFDLQSLTAVPSLSADEEYHLHIYSTKHNTHITFTRPDRGAIVSVSAGNIGFRKSHRGTYDAAYQLAAHVFKTIDDKKVKPRAIEVILRGFGQGREAVVKALLGQEGKNLRNAIRRVTDSTRLKFGGTRSKAPRRLG
jgi:small subunit ribosomal protein S11